MGSLTKVGAALKPHAGRSDGDASIANLREVVIWLMLVHLSASGVAKNWVCGDF